MWDHGAVVAAVAEAGMPQGSAQMRQRYGQGADAFRPLCEDQRKRAGDNISERCGGLSTCFQSLETATSFHPYRWRICALALSYPTSKAALAASRPSRSIRP